MAIVALLIALAGLMSAVCFGLLVILMSVVGRLWPSKDFPEAGWIASRKVISEQAATTDVSQTKFNVEELCQHLKMMPETELLRFGQAVKQMCSPEASREPQQEVFIVQLREARAEWLRRHPKPPLDDSI
jgi:hypothetical protein